LLGGEPEQVFVDREMPVADPGSAAAGRAHPATTNHPRLRHVLVAIAPRQPQLPACATLLPAAAAKQLFEYVCPSQPHTGS
jgi:hypothetical protein